MHKQGCEDPDQHQRQHVHEDVVGTRLVDFLVPGVPPQGRQLSPDVSAGVLVKIHVHFVIEENGDLERHTE